MKTFCVTPYKTDQFEDKPIREHKAINKVMSASEPAITKLFHVEPRNDDKMYDNTYTGSKFGFLIIIFRTRVGQNEDCYFCSIAHKNTPDNFIYKQTDQNTNFLDTRRKAIQIITDHVIREYSKKEKQARSGSQPAKQP